jgi:putative tricarboxylic transport membrane protein
MRKADLVVACLLGVLAAVVVAEGWRLGIGWSTDGPRPGFFVFYLGLALCGSCVVLAAQAIRRGDAPIYRQRFVEREQLHSVARVAVPAGLMVVLTHFVGLYVAGGIYLGVYMRWIGRHSWGLTVLLAAAIPVATFLVFEVWFLVPMPKGPLEALLGY